MRQPDKHELFLFDPRFYLSACPDLAAAGVDPAPWLGMRLCHSFGWDVGTKMPSMLLVHDDPKMTEQVITYSKTNDTPESDHGTCVAYFWKRKINNISILIL